MQAPTGPRPSAPSLSVPESTAESHTPVLRAEQWTDDLHRRLEREFARRGPWVTRFEIAGREYGGAHRLGDDPRLDLFTAAFPSARSVLELGSLEGGHSFALAGLGRRVTAVEGRRESIERARWVQEMLGVEGVEFVEANLEQRLPSSFGHFDVVFCSGLLYHLPRPCALLDDLRTAAEGLFLSTHYAEAGRGDLTEVDGVVGCWYEEKGPSDVLSGLSPRSFWFTVPALVRYLRLCGFSRVRILQDVPTPNGPCVTLAAYA